VNLPQSGRLDGPAAAGRVARPGPIAFAKKTPNWESVGSALLIRLRSIGDTVLMTPCLDAIKAWRPDIEISVLSEPYSAPLLEDHPLVDRLIIAGQSSASRARLIADLRRLRFDIAFNLHGGTTATVIAALSGARYTVGYHGYRQSWMLGWRAPSPDVILGRARIHSVEQQLALLGWSGVPWPRLQPKLALSVEPEAKARIQRRLAGIADLGLSASSAGFGVIAPAAAAEPKRWPAARFAAVADHLQDYWGLPCIIIAGPGQESVARESASASRSGPRVLTGLSLKELMALLSLAAVFVGNDSGPAHIAAAFECPAVVIFGPSNVQVWHPWTDSPYRVLCPNDGAVSRDSVNRDSASGAAADGIAAIPVGECITAVNEVLEGDPRATDH
jgi:heptosyltransferase-3